MRRGERGGGGKGWLSPPGAGAGVMLEGAKHPAAFLPASLCKDLLVRAVVWPLKYPMESWCTSPSIS